MDNKDKQYCCRICGKEIDEDEYEIYDGLCEECYDDEFCEESEDVWGFGL